MAQVTNNGYDDEFKRLMAVPDEFNPAVEAYQLRISGMGYREIAQRTGYSNEATCYAGVKNYIEKSKKDYIEKKREELLDMELARLDTLQQAWWQPATMGDDKAAQIVLKIIAQRAKFFGLEQPAQLSTGGGQGMVLVLGDGQDYVGAVKKIVANRVPQGTKGELDDESL